MSLRRLAVTLTALTAAASLPVPLTAASAAPAASPVIFLSDADNNVGLFGIMAGPDTDLAHAHPVLSTGSMTDVLVAKIAPDGQHLAALVDPQAGSDSDSGNYQLQVMNLDGTGQRTVTAETSDSTSVSEITGFSWAGNDSIVIGYSSTVFDPATLNATTTRDLRSVPAAGGTLTALPGSDDMADPAVDPSDPTKIAASYLAPEAPRGEVQLRIYDTVAQAKTANVIDTGFLGEPAWSHDGTHIAYVKDVSTNADFRSEIDVAQPDAPGSQPIVDAGVALFNESPSWSPDDQTLWFDSVDTNASTPRQSLWSVPSTVTSPPSTPQQQLAPAGADVAMPTLGPVDGTPPGTPAISGFGLAGTRTGVLWTKPLDSDYLYAIVTRDRGTPDEHVFTASGTSFVDATTVVGRTYSYDVTAVDAAGNVGAPSAPLSVVAQSLPRVVVSSPTSNTETGLAFPVSWSSAGAPAGTTYDVQWRQAGGATSTLLGATTHTSTTVTGVAGRTYQFRVRVVEPSAASAYSAWTSATVPYDQTAGHYGSGWHTLHASSFWLGSAAATSVNGSTVTFTVTSRGVQIIGDRLATGASFRVYFGGSYRGTVSTHASSTERRQVLWNSGLGSLAKRTVKLVAVVPKGHTLRLDGLAAAR